ncbi:MAG: peptidoglycan DD-metalloendopeptidase family protein, partial [Deltaproteobacteria bacterium]|nr:peptidoglycan DD-metalloendopeptidase family protein [Deltaproteobacteria bacterium]MBW1939976.1 peptidoglycan DD-metalloendopeptidase family protein [Deltaproteobacteria bacterium]
MYVKNFFIKTTITLAWIILVFIPGTVVASESQSVEIKRLKTKVKDISNKIEKHKVDFLSCSQKEAQIISALNNIDLSIDKTQKTIKSLRSEIDNLENKIVKSTDAAKDLSEKIKKTETYTLKRLVAFYKLNRLNKEADILASAKSMYELVTQKRAMEQILHTDEKLLENLIKDKVGRSEILVKLNSEKNRRLSLESDYREQVEMMSRERAEREKILKDIRTKKSFAIAAVNALKASRKSLDETIKSLTSDFQAPKQNKSRTNKKISKKTFDFYKGLLKKPVKGKILSCFGPYKNTRFNIVNFSSGIKIKADKGDPIHAVFSGRILYAGWFKGYGNMIIIDHGNHYHTLYAHAEELFKKKRDHVETGEVIATAGDTGSMTGPCLHFEVRHHGKPVDPLNWLNSN